MRNHRSVEPGDEEPSREDAEFARQLAAVLRTAESPGADFDDRVLAGVRAAHGAPGAATMLRFAARPAGWRRPRVVALPLAGWGALAAGFAAIVSVGTLALAGKTDVPRARHVASGRQTRPVNSAARVKERDTVYVVRFVLADAQARTVSLVGDFNAWTKRATPLTAAKAGVWRTQVALRAGRHEYAFVVDGKRWVADPAADRLADDFNTPSSIVTVGGDGVAEK